MVEEVQEAPGSIDPRVRRTRQMLHDALERLLRAKSIEKISVGDIAEEATLNRATFYDHYSDKFALLEGLVASRFQELLDKRGVVFVGGCRSALKWITLATCDYLAGLPGSGCPDRGQMEKLFETAVIAVVRGTILSGIVDHPPANGLAPGMMAAILSGAIYGGAREWARALDRVPAEQIADALVEAIAPIMA
jgi:AcrR family transcriptional regulator